MNKNVITVLSITRRDILVSFDSGLIYQHVSKNFEMRKEQVENVTDKTNVPFTLILILSRRECKPGIIYYNVLEWEYTFTSGQNTAKSSNYIEKCFKRWLSKIKFSTKNLMDASLYFPQEWKYGAPKIHHFRNNALV